MAKKGVLDSFSLKGKSAIVTGVSSGLGVSFTEGLAEAGADAVVCARRFDKLSANAKMIAKATGRKIVPVQADISKDRDIERVVEAAENEFGKIDILINNAGVGAVGSALQLERKDWDNTLSVDVSGVFLFSKHVAKSMIRHKVRGSIINLASIYGQFADIFPVVAYYSSKGAVVNMTRALAVELAQYSIRVNAIAPGFFPSEMTQDILKDKNVLAHITGRTPMGRLGDPQELKGAAVFLASDAASYVTGHILNVDGGWGAE